MTSLAVEALGFDPLLLLGVFLIIPAALASGYTVRKNTAIPQPSDFFTVSIFLFLFALFILTAAGTARIPLAWLALFGVFYLIGHRMATFIVDKECLEFVHIGKDDEGFLRMIILQGQYITHPKHGLCCLPTDNGRLFNQLFRRIYHKVEVNAPMKASVYLQAKKRPWDGKARPNIKNYYTGLRAVLIEDIKTTETPDNGRWGHPVVPKTVITLAYGSMVPRAQLLIECETIDQLNKNIAVAVAKAAEVETKVISKLPLISAEQLIAIAENNPVMEVVRQYMAKEEEEKCRGKGK